MATLCEEIISNFVTKHLALLEEERKEECEQSTKLINASQGGVCLKNVILVSYSSCLGGYVIAEFRSSKNNVLQTHSLSYGDVVGVIEGSNLQNLPIATGVVKFSKDDCIGVSFEDVNSFSEEESAIYTLVKLANDITYSRLKSSLKSLARTNKPGKVLADLLFGKNISLERVKISPLLLDSDGELKYINQNLHKDQKEAVKFALEMKNLAIIHGPPGTGKTTTLVEIILQLVLAKNKLLVCAPSNIAVDNIVEKLASHSVKMVRLGHPARVMDSTAKYSLDAIVDTSSSTQIVKDVRKDLNNVLRKLKTRHRKETNAELHSELKTLRKELQQRESRALDEVLRGADVVLSTLVTASDVGPLKHLPDDHFSCVLIDECSQALEAACWIALPMAPKAILAGDHLQLPPTIVSQKAEKGGLGLSLMERAIEKFGKEGYRLLTRQFRMHADIMTWPSQEMYEGQLEADSSVAGHLLKDLPHVETVDETEMTLLLVDTAGCDMEEEVFESSRCNHGEAGIIAVLAKRLVAANVPQTSIAVITPYNHQVELIRAHLAHLKGIEVRSVDGFQGREKEVVLLSMVRSNPERELGFISDRRRLNVAVSRARRFLCLVADSTTVSCDNTLASLLDYMTQHGIVHSAEQYVTDVEMPKEVAQNQKFQQSSKVQNEKKPEKQKKKKKNTQPQQDSQKQNEQQRKIDDGKQEKESYYQSLLKEFVSNDIQRELEFPKTISAFDRRLIHQAASELNLIHTSVGEGSDRYIVVRKSSERKVSLEYVDTSEKTKNTSGGRAKLSDKQPYSDEANTQNKTDSTNNSSVKTQATDISSAERVNPEVNSKTKTVEKTIEKQTDLKACEQTGINKTENKRKEKVNKKIRKKQEPEDFDSLIAEFQEMDKRCPWNACKVPTELVGLSCVHCKKRFCITHGLPELHGCGEAARRAARQDFRHPPPPKPNAFKRNAISKKLEKKLAQMAEERKPQKKET